MYLANIVTILELYSMYILCKSFTNELFFFQVWTQNNPRGLNLANRVHEEAIETLTLFI